MDITKLVKTMNKSQEKLLSQINEAKELEINDLKARLKVSGYTKE